MIPANWVNCQAVASGADQVLVQCSWQLGRRHSSSGVPWEALHPLFQLVLIASTRGQQLAHVERAELVILKQVKKV